MVFAPAPASGVNHHGNNQDDQIDSLHGATRIHKPRIHDGRDRQEEEPEQRHKQPVIGSAQVVAEQKQQNQHDSRKRQNQNGQEAGHKLNCLNCPTDRGDAAVGVESIFGMNSAARTVLIVDDEPEVLRLIQQMLRPRHVNVLIAPHPAEALEICEREPVHLLISDVRMPEMDGHKLAERVLELHPQASVLLISGYAKESPLLSNPAQVRFLRKPFFPAELIKQLKELLPGA